MSRLASCSAATDIGVVNRVLRGDAINHAAPQHHAGRQCMVSLCGANSSIRTEQPCTVDPPDVAKPRDRSHPYTGRHRTLPSPVHGCDTTPPPPIPSAYPLFVCSSSSPDMRGFISPSGQQGTKKSRIRDPLVPDMCYQDRHGGLLGPQKTAKNTIFLMVSWRETPRSGKIRPFSCVKTYRGPFRDHFC